MRTEREKIKGKAPGEGEVRMIFIKKVPDDVQQAELVKVISEMLEKGAEYWKERKESLKQGIVISLHKKGDKENPDNCRRVYLLSVGRRILVRVIETRL